MWKLVAATATGAFLFVIWAHVRFVQNMVNYQLAVASLDLDDDDDTEWTIVDYGS